MVAGFQSAIALVKLKCQHTSKHEAAQCLGEPARSTTFLGIVPAKDAYLLPQPASNGGPAGCKKCTAGLVGGHCSTHHSSAGQYRHCCWTCFTPVSVQPEYRLALHEASSNAAGRRAPSRWLGPTGWSFAFGTPLIASEQLQR